MPNIESLNNVNIRMLNADEFYREDLVKIFVENESLVPNPLVAQIKIAEDSSGKIIALAVLQPQYHAEPIYVDPEYRNTMLHHKIVESLLEPLMKIKGLRVFVFSPNSKIAKLAIRFGFKLLDYEVFMRKF